jgi:hypothetical protein
LCGENISTKILNQKKYNEEPRKIQDAYANHPNHKTMNSYNENKTP